MAVRSFMARLRGSFAGGEGEGSGRSARRTKAARTITTRHQRERIVDGQQPRFAHVPWRRATQRRGRWRRSPRRAAWPKAAASEDTRSACQRVERGDVFDQDAGVELLALGGEVGNQADAERGAAERGDVEGQRWRSGPSAGLSDMAPINRSGTRNSICPTPNSTRLRRSCSPPTWLVANAANPMPSAHSSRPTIIRARLSTRCSRYHTSGKAATCGSRPHTTQRRSAGDDSSASTRAAAESGRS